MFLLLYHFVFVIVTVTTTTNLADATEGASNSLGLCATDTFSVSAPGAKGKKKYDICVNILKIQNCCSSACNLWD